MPRSIRPAPCASRPSRRHAHREGAERREAVMTRRLLATAWAAAVLGFCVTPASAQERWQDRPGVKALYEKAKAEGEVVIWGPTQIEVDWIEGEFAKRFPGIHVKGTGDL